MAKTPAVVLDGTVEVDEVCVIAGHKGNPAAVARHGRDDTQPHRQRYRCTACQTRFDDLTGTALAGHHRPLRLWVLCL